MQNGRVIWFEIPVKDLDRAIHFYSTMLSVKIDRQPLLDKDYAVFKKENHGIGGVLVEREDHSPGKGPMIFFEVIDMLEVLEDVVTCGGKVVISKTLLRRKNEKGNLVFSRNLIDEDMGYYAKVMDSEGNYVGLYSHS